MFAGFVGVPGGPFVTYAGTLSATSGSSPVTSATVTIQGAGQLKFTGVTTDGGAPQYSRNSGAFVTITESLSVVFSNGDTLAVKATLIGSGATASFSVLRPNASVIENVVLSRA